MNRQQIYDALRLALGAGGPIAAIILRYTGVTQQDYEMWLQAALVILPPLIAWGIGWWQNREAAQIKAAAQVPGVQVHVDTTAAKRPVAAITADPKAPNVVSMAGPPRTK